MPITSTLKWLTCLKNSAAVRLKSNEQYKFYIMKKRALLTAFILLVVTFSWVNAAVAEIFLQMQKDFLQKSKINLEDINTLSARYDARANGISVSRWQGRMLLNKVVNQMLLAPGKDYYVPAGKGRLKRNYHTYIYAPDYKSNYYRTLAYLVYHADRSGKELAAIYRQVRPLVYEIISKPRYLSTLLSFYVEHLLSTLDHIKKIDPHFVTFEKILLDLRENPRRDGYCDAVLCGSFWNHIIDKEFKKQMSSPCEPDAPSEYKDYCDNRNAYWFYSFWLRRYKESNLETVQAILQDLKLNFRDESATKP